MAEYIRGTIATYNRAENILPEEWEKKIVDILPYGQTPITAIMDSLSVEKTESRKFHWWDEEEAPLNGNILGIYTDSGMTTPLTSVAQEDDVLYVKLKEEDANQILVNNTLCITGRPNTNNSVTFPYIVPADVKSVMIDGNNSRITIKLLKQLPNVGNNELDWFISGNAQEEGSTLPETVTREPDEYENQTQIFMGSCEITNSMLAEMERTQPDVWERTIKKALVRLRKEMENDIIFGVYKTSWVNNKQKRHMKGIYQAISEYSRIYDIKKYGTVEAEFAGQSWNDVGFDILDDIIIKTSRIKTDTDSKFVFTGDLGYQAINKLVREKTSYDWSSEETIFGFRVKTLLGTIKSLNFVIHPLFNSNNRFRRSALVVEGRYLKKKEFRPLMFITGKTGQDENGYDWIDGRKCGWVTEFGISWNYLKNFCWIDNLGIDVDAL